MCGQNDNFPFCKEHETLHDWLTYTIHDYMKTGKTEDKECCKDPRCPIGRSVRFIFKDVLKVLIMKEDEKLIVQCYVEATSKNQKKTARKIQEAIFIHLSHYTKIRNRADDEDYKRYVQKDMNDGKLGPYYSLNIENPITYDPENPKDPSDDDDPPEYQEEDAPPAYA